EIYTINKIDNIKKYDEGIINFITEQIKKYSPESKEQKKDVWKKIIEMRSKIQENKETKNMQLYIDDKIKSDTTIVKDFMKILHELVKIENNQAEDNIQSDIFFIENININIKIIEKKLKIGRTSCRKKMNIY